MANGPWKRTPTPKSSLQAVEIEIRHARRHLAGVVEERQVEIAVDHDAPLRLQQQAVLIAESPAAVAAQRRAAAKRRQHEERRLLAVLLAARSARAPRNDEHPGFAQDRDVLDGFVLEHLEAEHVVPVVVVVQRHAVEAAAARVAGRRAPVEPDRALGVQVGDFSVEARKGRGRVLSFDRREAALAGLLRPPRELGPAAQHQDLPRREDGEAARCRTAA